MSTVEPNETSFGSLLPGSISFFTQQHLKYVSKNGRIYGKNVLMAIFSKLLSMKKSEVVATSFLLIANYGYRLLSSS